MTIVTFADTSFTQMSGIYASADGACKVTVLEMGGCVHWPKADVLNGARVRFPASSPSPEPGRLPKYRPTLPMHAARRCCFCTDDEAYKYGECFCLCHTRGFQSNG